MRKAEGKLEKDICNKDVFGRAVSTFKVSLNKYWQLHEAETIS